MAPPLDQFFVEFQKVPNEYGLYAWGAHINAISDKPIEKHPGDDRCARWILKIDTYLEMQKGKPFGPVARHLCGLAEDGTWFKHGDGRVSP